MNVFQKVTIESLKKNRSRTIVTIIGIMLSTALICAVLTSFASLFSFIKDYTRYYNGTWHGNFRSISAEEVERISGDKAIKDTFFSKELGYSMVTYKPPYDDIDLSVYLKINGASEGFMDGMPIHAVDGRLPENSSELMIPSEYEFCKVGDTLELAIGEYDPEQSMISFFPTEASPQEILTTKTYTTKTYTVVGTYDMFMFSSWESEGIDCYTIYDGEVTEGTYDLYFHMKKPNDTFDFVNNSGLFGGTNDEVLMTLGVFRYAGFYGFFFGMAAVLIGIIVFGSVALIYNAFAISFSERAKQFGLLSSVGATKKQLRKMMEFEALAVSAIGIPLGILLGIGGIAVTFKLIGKKLDSVIWLMTENSFQMKLVISVPALILAVLISLEIVRISVWIPSARIRKQTIVESIRQNGDIKVKNRRMHTPKLIYKLFGLPGLLGHKYFKRSKKRYRATILSLFMSIVLFISAVGFTDYLIESVESEGETCSYDISILVYAQEDTDGMALMKEFSQADSAEKTSFSLVSGMSLYIKKDILTSDALNFVGNIFSDTGDEYKAEAEIFFVEDGIYREFLKDEGLDEDRFMSTESPCAVVYNRMTAFDIEKYKNVKFDIFDDDEFSVRAEENLSPADLGYKFAGHDDDGSNLYLPVDAEEGSTEYVHLTDANMKKEHNIEVGATVSTIPYFVSAEGDEELFLMYPMSASESISEHLYTNMYLYNIISSDYRSTYSDVERIKDKCGLSGYINNYAAEVEGVRNIVTIIKVFAYSFIVLISLIAVANVFNTMTTNINLRRREFAMLRSTGMSGRGLDRMMIFECLLYGTKALLFGLPVSAAVNYLIYRAVNENFESSYHLPWGAVGAAVLSVFAVVFTTMMYSINKVKKDNPIDALKNENI